MFFRHSLRLHREATPTPSFELSKTPAPQRAEIFCFQFQSMKINQLHNRSNLNKVHTLSDTEREVSPQMFARCL